MSTNAIKMVWWNGRMLPAGEVRLPITTHALHYGIGVFEGIRAYKRADGRTAVFRLREHIDRLFDSARVLGITIPMSRETIADACRATVRENGLPAGYIRPVAFLGDGPFGVGSTAPPVDVAIVALPWGSSLGADSLERGIRVRVSSFVRDHANAAMSKAKICGQYVLSTMAKREAAASGVDEAILLDAQGRVTEASAENIFLAWHGRLYTPPLELPILAGITRDAVMQLARKRGLDLVEQTVTRDMLYLADEMFLTGTAAEITPVREVDGRAVGAGEPGPMTRALQKVFFEAATGPGEPEPGWLAYV